MQSHDTLMPQGAARKARVSKDASGPQGRVSKDEALADVGVGFKPAPTGRSNDGGPRRFSARTLGGTCG